MKFGVREICDVVLRAKSAQKIGNKIFYKNEPVIYFDTLRPPVWKVQLPLYMHKVVVVMLV